jgi:hypothetical protein
MACNGGCALCCCCGPGQMVELPDYYCRFYPTLPVTGPNYGCSDTDRKYLLLTLTEQRADGSDAVIALNADNKWAHNPADDFRQQENTSCYMSYGTLFSPYSYGYSCFQNGSEYFEQTDWKEIERIQYRCVAQGTGGAYICVRSQTWARISWDIANPRAFIARCKIPTEACMDDIDSQGTTDLNEGDCAYLVVVTFNLCYKIETQSYISTSSPNAACSTLPDFYDEPTGTITTLEQDTICVTRSRVVSTLKGDPENPEDISIDPGFNSNVQNCCTDWVIPKGQSAEARSNLFRCDCDGQVSFEVAGECPPDLGIQCDETQYICDIDTLSVPFAAGYKWRLTSSS